MRWVSALALAFTVLLGLFTAGMAAAPTKGAPCDPKFAKEKYLVPRERSKYFGCVELDIGVGDYQLKDCPEGKPLFNFTVQACTKSPTKL